jgi:membrane protease YdiL (CAAX protease family)
MPNPQPLQEFLELLRNWLVLALACGLVALVAWGCLAVWGKGLLPRQRLRAVPWEGIDLLAIFILVFRCWPIPFLELLKATGFFNWLYGPEFKLPGAEAKQDSVDLNSIRAVVWAGFFAAPVQIATIPVFLRVVRGVRPYQLGLIAQRWLENSSLGVLAGIGLTPVVLGVHALTNWVYVRIAGAPPEHPLSEMANHQASSLELVMLIFTAVCAAPILEELFFRGLLQPWFASRPYGGSVAMVLALAVPIEGLPQIAPFIFVAVMVPGYLIVEHLAWPLLKVPHAARAIYGSALVFAASHYFAWPTPIPLFILGLGLGYLAFRTQSLVAPIVLHAFFNGVSCLSF